MFENVSYMEVLCNQYFCGLWLGWKNISHEVDQFSHKLPLFLCMKGQNFPPNTNIYREEASQTQKFMPTIICGTIMGNKSPVTYLYK